MKKTTEKKYKMKALLILSLLIFTCIGCKNEKPERIKAEPKINFTADFFAPEDVQITGGPLLDLQKHGEDYLLWLNPDSLLHFFYIEAGLKPKSSPYAGWESEEVWGAGPLRGGFMGYYISSLALMYKTTGNKQLLDKLEYTLTELIKCQEAGNDGYVLAIKDGRKLFKDVSEGKIKTDNPTVNGAWAPLYLINKMMHGFTTAYVNCGEDKALILLTNLADWFGYQVLDKLSEDQIQELLVCEHGSINESFIDTYSLTGEKRYLDWAAKLNDKDMWEPLSQNKDILHGWHANTQIPKFTGFLKYYSYIGDERFRDAAVNFWNIVLNQHTWVIGGNSTGEHFFPTSEFEKRILLIGGPETCNSANMMRLTESLFTFEPNARLVDYYERVLLNHILSAYDCDKGMCTYFTPMRPSHYRIYGSQDSSFWCCNQSGLETPAKLNKFIYANKGNDLMVNLFIPSKLNWEENGIKVEQTANIAESGQITLNIENTKDKDFKLYIRKPKWASTFNIKVNGKEINSEIDKSGYFVIDNKWERENTVSIDLSMNLYSEKLNGSDNYISLLYGPYVLAGRMGKENLPSSFWAGIDNTAHNKIPIPQKSVLAIDPNFLNSVILKSENSPLTFKINKKGYEDIKIEPFYKIHFERYTIYWPLKKIQE